MAPRPTESLRSKPRHGPGMRFQKAAKPPLEERQEEMRERVAIPQTRNAIEQRDAEDAARHAIDQADLQDSGMTPEQAQALLTDKVKASAIDPDTLQMLMAFTALLGKELRKPSLKEEKEEAEKLKRQREASLRAAEDGARDKATIEAYQGICTHFKDNGDHLWRGQPHGTGEWAVVRCQRCLLQYRVRCTPQMVQSGLNLDQIRGLTRERIQKWADDSAAIDIRLREAGKQMAEIQRQAGIGSTANVHAQPIPL
jgi:hypothetical protein